MLIQNDGHIRLTRLVVIWVIAILGGRAFIAFPFGQIMWEVYAGYLALLILFFGFYFTTVFSTIKKTEFFALVIVFLSFILATYSAVVANLQYGQPVIYGLLVERRWIAMIGLLVLLFLYRKRLLTLSDMHKAVMYLAWFMLTAYVAAYLYFDIEELLEMDEFYKTTAGSRSRGTIRYMFDWKFLTFACIYYLVAFNQMRRWRYFFLFSPFFFYILYVAQSRTTVLVLLAMWIVISFKERRVVFNIKALPIFVLALLIGIYTINQISPGWIDKMLTLFQDALNAVSGVQGEDSSANSRIHQVSQMYQFWEGGILNIVFGSGTLSQQWNGGFGGIYGHLHPIDSGLIGVFFVYGFPGLIYLSIVYYFLFKLILPIKDKSASLFVTAVKYYIIYIILETILTGGIMFRNGNVVPFAVILIMHNYAKKQKPLNIQVAKP